MEKSSVKESLSERGPEVNRISYAQLTEHIDESSGTPVARLSEAQNAAALSEKEGDDALASCDEIESSENTSAVSRTSPKRTYEDCEDELHYVPEIKKYHKTWEDSETYLKRYQEETYTVLVISETLNVRLRNRRIERMKTHAGKDPETLPLVPEDLDPFERVYICTHGWKARVRSKKSRPVHRIKGVGCQVRLRAQLVKMSSGKRRIQVKNAFYGHSYQVSQEVYKKYLSVLQVPATHPVMKDVELMVASGRKTKSNLRLSEEKKSRGGAPAPPAAQVHQGHDVHVQSLNILQITG
eukprot:jgi/Phyca11/128875/e_gw1.79.105.1